MKRNLGILTFLIVFILLLSACSSEKGSVDDSDPSTNGENNEGEDETDNTEEDNDIDYTFDTDLSGEINFWSWGVIFEDVISEFNKVYPNIEVNLSVIEIGELHDKLQTTIAAGSGAPDVSHTDTVSRYGIPGLLEDLSQSPYNADRFEGETSDYIWERWKTFDGKRLLAIPWDITPGVWYYRADIYEQLGLPSDPEQLGEFLQDPENVLTAAQTLSANDKYMFEFRDSPAILYGDAVGYFDSDFNYLRNDEQMIEMLDLVKRGVQLEWAPQKSVIFDDEGVQLLKQGKVASFPAGSQMVRTLAERVPEQSGDWSVTKLPLGLNLGMSGSTFVIPSQSENKEAAWAFVEWITRSEEAWKIYMEKGIQPAWKHITSLPWFQELTNEFLGDIRSLSFFDTLNDQIPVRRFTELDGQSWPIYIDAINESIDNNIDSKTTLQQIEDNTMKQLGADIKKIQEEYESE